MVRAPRWVEGQFYGGRPRPPGNPTFLAWAPARPWRFAAVQFGMGFWGVFVAQLYLMFIVLLLVSGYSFVLQLVVGAPVFEEMLKFGLALLFVAPFGQGGAARGVVLVLRAVVAFAAGFAFGTFEHWSTYSDEPVDFRVDLAPLGLDRELAIYWRELFHGLSTLLSMVLYGILESLPDKRARWLAPVPSILLHYANNALAIPVALSLGMEVAQDMSTAIVALLFAFTIVVAASPKMVRQVARWQTATRFPRGPPAEAGP